MPGSVSGAGPSANESGPPKPEYTILLSQEGLEKAAAYLTKLQSNPACVGKKLQATAAFQQGRLDDIGLVEALLTTKEPQIFAESAVHGDGSDWTIFELSILGDVSVAVPVTIYDDGTHVDPKVHEEPFPGTLIYTCGALLNPEGRSADWDELVPQAGGGLSDEAYFKAYRRRLVPCFQHANDVAKENGKRAFITVPGLGCGQFAGPFRGSLGEKLSNTVAQILNEQGEEWLHICAVYFDAFAEGQVGRRTIHGMEYITQPLRSSGPRGRPQLCNPLSYEGAAGGSYDSFGDCEFFSLVAWDHVSWPGNDYWIGDRATDDGVKAAATDTMFRITGVEGCYNRDKTAYAPPEGFPSWLEVVNQCGITFDTSSIRLTLKSVSGEVNLSLTKEPEEGTERQDVVREETPTDALVTVLDPQPQDNAFLAAQANLQEAMKNTSFLTLESCIDEAKKYGIDVEKANDQLESLKAKSPLAYFLSSNFNVELSSLTSCFGPRSASS